MPHFECAIHSAISISVIGNRIRYRIRMHVRLYPICCHNLIEGTATHQIVQSMECIVNGVHESSIQQDAFNITACTVNVSEVRVSHETLPDWSSIYMNLVRSTGMPLNYQKIYIWNVQKSTKHMNIYSVE